MSNENLAEIDNNAVQAVSHTMAIHMAMARMKGKQGWQHKDLCDSNYLSQLFARALNRGRLISAMNYLMMLWVRGEKLNLSMVRIELGQRTNDDA